MLNYDDFTFYRSMKMGRSKPLGQYAKEMITYAYGLTMDGRAFIEDIEGGISLNHVNYIKTLKWRLLDLFGELDTVLCGCSISDPIHFSPLLLEYGFTEIVNISGERLINIFDLHDTIESTTISLQEIITLWENILNKFPGDIPNPLTAQGHLDYMEGMKSWTALCERVGLDIQIVKDLIREA